MDSLCNCIIHLHTGSTKPANSFYRYYMASASFLRAYSLLFSSPTAVQLPHSVSAWVDRYTWYCYRLIPPSACGVRDCKCFSMNVRFVIWWDLYDLFSNAAIINLKYLYIFILLSYLLPSLPICSPLWYANEACDTVLRILPYALCCFCEYRYQAIFCLDFK